MEEDGLPKNNEVFLCLYMYTCHAYLCMHAFKNIFQLEIQSQTMLTMLITLFPSDLIQQTNKDRSMMI